VAVVSSTSCFSSLLSKELMLKADGFFGLNNGFEAFLMISSAGGSRIFSGSEEISITFSTTFTSSFTSCFS